MFSSFDSNRQGEVSSDDDPESFKKERKDAALIGAKTDTRMLDIHKPQFMQQSSIPKPRNGNLFEKSRGNSINSGIQKVLN